MDKHRLRKQILSQTHHDLESLNRSIFKRVLDTVHLKDTVGIYVSRNQEVDTIALIHYCLKNNIDIACPRIEGKEMVFYRIHSFDDLSPRTLGILEPDKNCEKVSSSEISVMFVPMVCFNHGLYRIGYGGGYYDRYLAQCNALKVGLAFSFQAVDVAFEEPFDIACDKIVTEHEILCQMDVT